MLKNSSVKRNISTSLMKGCNMKKTYSVAMMGVAASLLLTHGAYGSIISPSSLGGPFNTASSSVSTPNPGVEGTGSNNTLTFFEDVTVLFPTNWGALFAISNTGPNNTTEYLVTKVVTNDTGKQWSNFFIRLSAGIRKKWHSTRLSRFSEKRRIQCWSQPCASLSIEDSACSYSRGRG